jgi:hypothetical protein
VSAAVPGVVRVRSGWPRLLLAVWAFGLAFLVARINWYAWNIERHFPDAVIRKWEPLFKADLRLFVTFGLLYFIVANVLGMTRPQIGGGD